MAKKQSKPQKDKDDTVEQIKSIFLSKTFWVNMLALIAFGAQRRWGFVMDEALQAQILTLVNIGLRMMTKEKVTWK